MHFYARQHQFYCGIDLHARSMYLCILDSAGKVLLHRNLPTDAQHLLEAIRPYQEDIVVGVECIFTWYWIADVCAQHAISFVLGHALYMKAIHGGKTKNDKLDSQKIAGLLRAGMMPLAYAYPQAMRSTRDLLRRRMYLMHQQSELLAHIQNTNAQYNLAAFKKRINYQTNRAQLSQHFPEPMVRKNVQADIDVLDALHHVLLTVERAVLQQARAHDPLALRLIRSVPGIGKILSLVILYEVQDISRFSSAGNFISYSRLVKCPRESAGKKSGARNSKIGNVHLKWAFSEAAVTFLRDNEPAQHLHQKLLSKYGKAKALSIIAQKLGRTIYFMLKHKEAFDPIRFFQDG
jgi:transposase